MTIQDPESSSAVVDLNDYLEVFSRRRWLILGAVGVGGLLALLYTLLQVEKYTAESAVLVRPGITSFFEGAQRADQLISMSTEREVMRSIVVATLAAQKVRAADDQRRIDDGQPALQLTSEEREAAVRKMARNLREAVDIQAVSDSQVIEVGYTDPNPERAKSVVNAFADAYLAFRQTESENTSAAARNAIDNQIAALETELAEANRVLTTAAEDSNEYRSAQVSRDVGTSEMATLRRQAGALVQVEINAGSVIDPVEDAPLVPSSPNRTLNLIVGVLLGGLVGVGLAFLRHRTDDRLVQRKNSLELFGMRILGTVPKPRGTRGAGALAGLSDEATRRMSSNVAFLAENSEAKVLLISSPNLDASPVSIAANLAVSASRIGKNVLLVSANLREPRVHDIFDLSNSTGLVDVLVGEVGPDVAMQVNPEYPRLDILTGGAAVPQPDELFQTEAFRYLMNSQRDRYDLIVIEAPAVNNYADALAIAPQADGVVVVAEDGKTTKSDLRFAVGQLQGIGAQIFGSVMVQGSAARRSSGGAAKKAKAGSRA